MTWWRDLSQTGRGLVTVASLVFGAVGGAFALGAATSSTLDGHRDLPERVTAVEAQLPPMQADITWLKVEADASRDARMALDTVSAAVSEIQCILRAQVEGANASRCLPTYRGGR